MTPTPLTNWKESDSGYRSKGERVSAAQQRAGAVAAARLEGRAEMRLEVVAAALRVAVRAGLDADQFGTALREELANAEQSG